MRTPHKRNFEYWYGAVAILGLLSVFLAEAIHFKVFFAWVSFAFAIVACAYFFKKPNIFRKSVDGRIPNYISWLLWPFLVSVQLYNAIVRKRDATLPIQEISPGLFIGRRLLPSDVHLLESLKIDAILDVTSEFNSLQWSVSDSEMTYLNIPVLDHQSPNQQDIIKAINWINKHRNSNKSVLVHCALGRGRSVLIVAAYLLAKYPEKTVREVLESITNIRHTARLNMDQLRTLETVHQDDNFRLLPNAWIIANPVAGGGKWAEHRQSICEQLGLFYSLTVVATTPELSANELAREACAANAKLIIAAGGDGTVNEVAPALVGTDIALAIIPLGTTNALSHFLWGAKAKFAAVDIACEAIISGKPRPFDVGLCNGEIFYLASGYWFRIQDD